MSDYLSTTPADGTLAARCRLKESSAFPLEGQFQTKYITHRGAERIKK
jgi:hypothetical protein